MLGKQENRTLEKGYQIQKSINYLLILNLEKEGYIREDITKARVNYIVKQKLKSPDIRIITANIEYSSIDKEEFRKQISEMLSQNLIKRSESLHRSAAFIVRNHSEIKREKARIVYNYKRLNDNTKDGGYIIPNKDSLINLIQKKKVFTNLI